jgi:Ca2+-transporting ATPase
MTAEHPATGLTAAEAAARLAADGPNELPRAGQRSTLQIVLGVLKEPMLALLLAGGIIDLALGDTTEALVLLGFACLSILITAAPEIRAERALAALRDLASPRALVLRDGTAQRIPGRAVVRGDVVLLGEGDRVPADGVIISGDALRADESLLTGESVPVSKAVPAGAPPTAMMRPGGDGLPFVFSGSLVVAGNAMIRVLATGPASEIGRIGGALSGIVIEVPRLYRQTRRLVVWMATLGGAAIRRQDTCRQLPSGSKSPLSQKPAAPIVQKAALAERLNETFRTLWVEQHIVGDEFIEIRRLL